MSFPIAFVEIFSMWITRMWYGWDDATFSTSPTIMGTSVWMAQTIPVWSKYTYTTKSTFTLNFGKYHIQGSCFRGKNHFSKKSYFAIWYKLEA